MAQDALARLQGMWMHIQADAAQRVQLATPTAQGTPKLLDRLREALRSRHYSQRTEQAYCIWVKRFIYFHNRRHPEDMAEPEINAFLSHLGVKEHVSASTQNQALSALLFLYRHVLGRKIGELGAVIRARKPKRVPVVMTRGEVKAVVSNLRADKRLMAMLMYGSGLRLMECLRLRVKDIDFATNQITVREGKGGKDRITMLPQTVKQPLLEHLKTVQRIHQQDLVEGYGCVALPDALARKYPNAAPNGAGNSSFHRSVVGSIGARENRAVIISMNPWCSGL
jgi:integron integrase